MISKVCTKCKAEKPGADFPADRHLISGISSQCRACHAVRSARYYQTNRERVLARSRAWVANNLERAKERQQKNNIPTDEWERRKAATKERQRAKYLAALTGRPSGGRIKMLTGRVFGRLTVFHYVGTEKKGAIWLCLCECGNVYRARARNLIVGNLKSCGCRGITPLVCTKCGIRKEAEKFAKNRKKVGTICKECSQQRSGQWAKDNREHLADLARKRYRNNPVIREQSHNRSKAAKFLRKTRMKNIAADLTASQWRAIQAAYKHRCAYCHKRKPLTQDHVVPVSKGGAHTANNIIPACRSCNSSKGARMPQVIYQPHLIA